MNFKRFPFIRFTFAFITGILISIYFPQPYINTSIFFSLLGTYLVFFILQKKFKYTLKSVLGFLSFLSILIFGYLLTEQKKENLQPNHISFLENKGKIEAFKGVIIEPIKETEKSFKTIIKIENVKIENQWVQASGKVLSYLQKDSSKTLKYGDRVILATFFEETPEPKNPSEFNYKQYLVFHSIFHRCYVKSIKYKVIGPSELNWKGSPNFFIYHAQNVRSFLEQKLKKHFKQKREYGIAQALILGVKDELENDVIKAYSGVGAMHVLAVSGLHVGLVFQVFVMLLGWINHKKCSFGKHAHAFILLSVIWLYAFLTGLSPSVMRAATMFSFIIIGDALGKQTNIYNTLAISAFFLLSFNPFLLMEVGFQLSYLAVLGIVYIQPKIYRLLYIENSIIDKIWSITCVSIAAQIGTFPLGLLYFHQFPTYFFISNLIVIPAAVLILYSGMFVLAFSWSDKISETFTFLLEKMIWGVNEIIFALNKMPHALLSGIDISILEAWLIYITLILFLVFFYFKKIKYYFYSCLFIFLISAFQFHEFVDEKNKNEIIFYAVNNHLALGLRNGEKITFISNDSLSYNSDMMQFNIYHHWWKENISDITTIDYEQISSNKNLITTDIEGNRLLVWNNKRILFYEKPINEKFIDPIKIDYLVLHKNTWVNTDNINKNILFDKIIIDGTNNWKTSNWIKKCYPTSYYDLKKEGYLLVKIEDVSRL